MATSDEVTQLLHLFDYGTLPGDLGDTYQRFHDLAHWQADTYADDQYLSASLRALVAARNAAVSSHLQPKPAMADA